MIVNQHAAQHIPQDGQPLRILVRGTRWIGDAVMTVPALRELRAAFPNSHITLAAGAWARDLFRDADFIDGLLMTEPAAGANRFVAVWRDARVWRAGRFDRVVLFQNSFASALTARLANIKHRVGYDTDGRGFLLTNKLEVPAWRGARHEVFYYLNIVRQIEATNRESRSTRYDSGTSHEPDASLAVSSARTEEAGTLLRRHGIDAGDATRPLVVLCPGSTNSRAKRWHTESFARLADRLADECAARVIIIGVESERTIADEIVARSRRPPLVLAGETTLAESVAILNHAALVVSNDTGTAHIAGALARPTLVLFGPTNPVTTAPFSASAEVMREPPACAPCMLRDCPIDHRCMTAITPDAVFDRAAKILASRSATITTNIMPEVSLT